MSTETEEKPANECRQVSLRGLIPTAGMKTILLILLVPSPGMAILGVYWVSMVRMLDGKRAEFLQRPQTKIVQERIDELTYGQIQPNVEDYRVALKKQGSFVEWERGYYERLRRNMLYLDWFAWFIAFCQLVATYYIYKRLREARLQRSAE